MSKIDCAGKTWGEILTEWAELATSAGKIDRAAEYRLLAVSEFVSSRHEAEVAIVAAVEWIADDIEDMHEAWTAVLVDPPPDTGAAERSAANVARQALLRVADKIDATGEAAERAADEFRDRGQYAVASGYEHKAEAIRLTARLVRDRAAQEGPTDARSSADDVAARLDAHGCKFTIWPDLPRPEKS
jgi:predicted RNA methylase